jgi:(p)ppGpp synthase/HD superfamily hydrolase
LPGSIVGTQVKSVQDYFTAIGECEPTTVLVVKTVDRIDNLYSSGRRPPEWRRAYVEETRRHLLPWVMQRSNRLHGELERAMAHALG